MQHKLGLLFYNLQETTIPGMKSLTLTEIRERIGEDNSNDPNGHYLPGVGSIRLQNAMNTVFHT